jgi:methylenetetrahydrofolate--tRNA-(uracil-5-)-methyltransferase
MCDKEMSDICVIGAGLAGCEAAYYLGRKGHITDLYEMKPLKFTKAHSYEGFCELVCSNSLKSKDILTASGLLKKEMRMLGSLVMEAADNNSVDAGSALAVDRRRFSDYVTRVIGKNNNIRVISKEVMDIEELGKYKYIIIATGPLTTEKLADSIAGYTGEKYLHFFDAASPIISDESIDHDIVFAASRYNKGTPDYLNCPMTKEQYDLFYNELINAEATDMNTAEERSYFEACMPIEEIARRGYSTPLFGPMKPVGIEDPKDPGKRFHAIVQLRKEDAESTMYNLVGFQTRLKFSEQKRVFSLIPGLEKAEFLRYGVMHRNTYIDSPRILDRFYRSKENDRIFFTGQITGVEGYLESASSGLYAALQLDRIIRGYEPYDFGSQTMIGALSNYISNDKIKDFQPMNANFGIMKDLTDKKLSKKERKEAKALASIQVIKEYMAYGSAEIKEAIY